MSNTNTSPVVTVAEAVELSRIAFGAGRMFHLEGKGGAGKTSVFQTLIAEANDISSKDVWVANLSGMGPQELLGYGIPDSESRDLWFSSPEVWPTVERVGSTPTLLVLDEFSQWDAASRSLCRSLFQPVQGCNPRVGTHELGSNVVIGITSNRRTDGTRAAVLEAPFVERCLTATLQPTLTEFLSWSVQQDIHRSPVYAFLRFANGDGADHFNPDLPTPWNGAPHPCPRAWEACLRSTGNDAALLSDPTLLRLSLQGLVGERAGSAAASFCQLVGSLMSKVHDIRSGSSDRMPNDPSNQYALLYAAIRMACGECAKDPAAAVASGSLDWLVDKFLLENNINGELRTWAFETATAHGIPLTQHPRRQAMQGV